MFLIGCERAVWANGGQLCPVSVALLNEGVKVSVLIQQSQLGRPDVSKRKGALMSKYTDPVAQLLDVVFSVGPTQRPCEFTLPSSLHSLPPSGWEQVRTHSAWVSLQQVE